MLFSKVRGENEKCVFYFYLKTEGTFWPTQYFLYTSNEEYEDKVKETVLFIAASKRIKYLGINLTKEAQTLYYEDHKTLLKKLKKT